MTLITLVDDSTRRVRAFVAERDISQVCLGEQAQISVDGVLGMQSAGRVENIAPDVTENPYEPGSARSREVTLSLFNNERPVTIGLTVSVTFKGCGRP
jgi:hypothetical protein